MSGFEYHEMKDKGKQQEEEEGDQETSFIDDEFDEMGDLGVNLKENPDPPEDEKESSIDDEFDEMGDLGINRKEDPVSSINESSDPYVDNTAIRNEVIISEERNRRIKRGFNHKNAKDFFTNILDLEPKCSDPEFIDYLVDTGVLTIRQSISESGLVIDYSVKYLGGDFQSIGRTLTGEETNLLVDGIRGYYESWTERERNKILKEAGIATAIGLSIIALVSGLIIGLTRKGADMVRQAKEWEKLTPAKKKVIPWIELEKATGKVVIFTGEHIVIIITLVGIYIYSK